MTHKFTKFVFSVICLGCMSTAMAQSYVNEPASAVWAFNDTLTYDVAVITPEAGISLAGVELGSATTNGTGTGNEAAIDGDGNKITFIKIKPANGKTDLLEWYLKPAQGLTFTPTKISMYIQRFATDSQSGVKVSASAGNSDKELLGTYTAPRYNRTQAEDKYGTSSDYTHVVDIELTEAQQAALVTEDVFHLYATIGVDSGKEAGFSNVCIEGVLNGNLANVEKYTLTLSVSPEEAGEASVRPASEEYEAGSELTVSTTGNFGYKFSNWTDADGTFVSDSKEFSYTINKNSSLTANYVKVNTYELAVNIEGGANDYMVQISPDPTVVEGKNMYEDGTVVKVTALSNPILAFKNWSTEATDSVISITMNADKELTANYKAGNYVVGWDFWKSGNKNRPADFASTAANDSVPLILRDAEGNEASWLEKSQESAGGYEGRPAAVNWREGELGTYYWQTKVNAEDFTGMKLITAMLINYNAYSKQNVQYSIDGENWTTIATIELKNRKEWVDAEIGLPNEANNQPELYIRWISDTTSKTLGTEGEKDGIALGASYLVIGESGTVGVAAVNAEPVATEYYDLFGSKVSSDTKGVLIKVERLSNGKTASKKIMNF